MALDLAALCAPTHTALCTQECQRGVIGDRARLPDLAAAAQAQAVPNIARLAAAARGNGVQVVHGNAARRADSKGASHNARLFAAMGRMEPLLPGSPDVEVVPEIGCAPEDVLTVRLHGLSPMHGTELDAILRNLGVTTIVVVGVSVNVAVTNFAFDAVNLGYQVVIPRDAVCGVPVEYADAVIDNTLALVATITTTDDLVGVWSATGP